MKIIIEGGTPTLRRILLTLIQRDLSRWLGVVEEGDTLHITNKSFLARYL